MWTCERVREERLDGLVGVRGDVGGGEMYGRSGGRRNLLGWVRKVHASSLNVRRSIVYTTSSRLLASMSIDI